MNIYSPVQVLPEATGAPKAASAAAHATRAAIYKYMYLYINIYNT